MGLTFVELLVVATVPDQLAFPVTVQGWVALILALLLAALGMLDTWLAVVYGESATVSAVVREASSKYPALPLAIGLLVGHLFL